MGSDLVCFQFFEYFSISIHAPRMGSDLRLECHSPNI